MSLVKKVQSSLALRNATVDALVELVVEEPPASLVEAEVERRVHDMGHRLEQQGANLAQYLEAVGQTGEELLSELRAQAAPSVKADLALRAVAETEGIEPTEEDIDAEIERLARTYDLKPNQVRRNLERADQMPAVRSDWKKSKALEWLLEHVETVDAEGQPIDRALLSASAPPDSDSEAASEVPQDEETGER